MTLDAIALSGWAILAGDWSIGGRFRLVSGNPTTVYTDPVLDVDANTHVPREPTSQEGIPTLGPGMILPSNGVEYGSRLPPFHQLDLRIDYKMSFDHFLLNAYADILNVYNHANEEFREWDFRYRHQAGMALLPFLPVIGVSAEF